MKSQQGAELAWEGHASKAGTRGVQVVEGMWPCKVLTDGPTPGAL